VIIAYAVFAAVLSVSALFFGTILAAGYYRFGQLNWIMMAWLIVGAVLPLIGLVALARDFKQMRRASANRNNDAPHQ
jgi:type VI protein secretion system component VasK